ncbi:MAG: ABC transporter permease [Cyclobacteriaceae bacterium]|jgi:putative ABC transport system permease protein|nr:ABC transporter permease [Flammeovirgaceae bacterium]
MINEKPPKWADKFLQWYCRPELLEEIQGDTHELFYRKAKESKSKAALLFIWNVLRFFRWKNIKRTKNKYESNTSTSMLQNFFKTAFRNIIKNKAYSFINYIGLTCGLTLALLILAYVRNEMSYDQFHEKANRLYRFGYTVSNGMKIASTPPPIAPALKSYYPEVEEVARVYPRNVSINIPGTSTTFEETNVLFADSAITNMFTFQFLKGNSKRALHDKFTVLLTEKTATKYFGDKNPIGESLVFSGRQSFKVIGVVKDFPENSHLRFTMLVPYDDMFDLEDEKTEQVLRANLAMNFLISHSFTYVLLKEGSTPTHINNTMNEFLKKNANPNLLVGQIFSLMPLTDLHLKSDYEGEPSTTNSMSNIYIFIGVGILTLLIAAINYVNLSTAQSFTRIKEIGLRKILGSAKSQLIVQFLAESFTFCVAAFVASYLLFYLALPKLNVLTGKELVFSEVIDFNLLALSIGIVMALTLLAGGYPAYFVTRFESVSALKGGEQKGGRKQLLRKALVVFQLAIACMLFSGSILIVKQLNFLETRPLGFQKEHIINIPLQSQNINGYFQQGDSTFQTRLQSFRDLIARQTGVNQSTLSSGSPGGGVVFRGTIPEGFTQEDNIFAANLAADYNFLETFDIKVVAGRSFSKEYGTDAKEAFIINETAVKEYKWETPEKALGKEINREGKKGKVVGVIQDFNFLSLTTSISPLLLSIDQNQFNTLSIRFDNENVDATIETMEAHWNKIFPEKAFEFSFLDEQLNQQYANYKSFGLIIQTFAGIAILIACLGVYGLVLFTVQRKVKEIGIRKVMGATVPEILKLVYQDFVLLIVLGFVLAVPVSYYFISQWLENFVYRTSIDVMTYAISLISIVVIVSLTISYQSIRAALANPVKSLRVE